MSIGSIIDNIYSGFSGFLGKIDNEFRKTVDILEAKTDLIFRKIKKKMFRVIFEGVFFVASLSFLLLGAVLFFRRFFPLDLVLVAAGVLCLYALMLFRWLK